MLLNPVTQRFQRIAFVALLASIPDQQTLTQRSAEGIDHISLTVGILLHQLACGDDSGLIGGGKTGGKCQHQCILTCLKCWLNHICPTVGIDSGSGGNFTGAKTVVKFLNTCVYGVGTAFTLKQDG